MSKMSEMEATIRELRDIAYRLSSLSNIWAKGRPIPFIIFG